MGKRKQRRSRFFTHHKQNLSHMLLHAAGCDIRPAAASSVVKKVYLGSWIQSENDKSSAAEPEGVENPNQRWRYTAYRRFLYTAKRCMRICASHGPLLEASLSLHTEMKNYISESRSTSKELTKVDAAGHGHGGNHRTSS